MGNAIPFRFICNRHRQPFVPSLKISSLVSSLNALISMLENANWLPPLLVPQHPAHSQFELPTEASVFSPPLVLALLVTLGFSLLWIISANRFEETLSEDRHSEALTALMAIFTPTKSSWPSDILDATRTASASRLRSGFSGSSSGVEKGEIRLRFSAVYEHILNSDLELQPTASVDLVKAMLLERNGMEVDGWRIKVVVEWIWMWRISVWIIKGLGARLVNWSELWNGDMRVSLVLVIGFLRFFLKISRCVGFGSVGYDPFSKVFCCIHYT